MKRAIIIFVRNPVPGKVKTRLAKTVGDGKALEIYMRLLFYTKSITASLDCDKYVFYADGINTDDIWENKVFYKRLQEGDDLGERMQNAFHSLFKKGYGSVMIIGSDCPELTSAILEDAFSGLDKVDVVVGPSADGGYYLLGMNRLYPSLFEDKAWSTSSVFNATVDDATKAGAAYSLLPVLHDVDEEEDLVFLK